MALRPVVLLGAGIGAGSTARSSSASTARPPPRRRRRRSRSSRSCCPGLQNDDVPLGHFLGLNTWVDLRPGLDEPEALQRLVAGAQGQAHRRRSAAKLLAGLCALSRPAAVPRAGCRPVLRPRAVRRRADRQGRPAHGHQRRGGPRPLGQRQVLDRLSPACSRRCAERRGWASRRCGTSSACGPAPSRCTSWRGPSTRPEPMLSPIADPRRAQRATPNACASARSRVAELVRDRLQADPGSTRLLLYVDQWEELYTQAQPREIKTDEDQAPRRRRAAVRRPRPRRRRHAPCTLVLSVRSDFYPDIQNHDAPARRRPGLPGQPRADERSGADGRDRGAGQGGRRQRRS